MPNRAPRPSTTTTRNEPARRPRQQQRRSHTRHGFMPAGWPAVWAVVRECAPAVGREVAVVRWQELADAARAVADGFTPVPSSSRSCGSTTRSARSSAR
jgi:hypothetical protein